MLVRVGLGSCILILSDQNIRPTIVNFRKWQAVQGAMPWVASDVALQAFSEAHDPESPLHISGKVRYS